jgi:hypothetical protein
MLTVSNDDKKFFGHHLTMGGTHAPPFGDRKISITIQHTPIIGQQLKGVHAYVIILEKKLISCFTFLPRQPKNFGCHLMVWVC